MDPDDPATEVELDLDKLQSVTLLAVQVWEEKVWEEKVWEKKVWEEKVWEEKVWEEKVWEAKQCGQDVSMDRGAGSRVGMQVTVNMG